LCWAATCNSWPTRPGMPPVPWGPVAIEPHFSRFIRGSRPGFGSRSLGSRSTMPLELGIGGADPGRVKRGIVRSGGVGPEVDSLVGATRSRTPTRGCSPTRCTSATCRAARPTRTMRCGSTTASTTAAMRGPSSTTRSVPLPFRPMARPPTPLVGTTRPTLRAPPWFPEQPPSALRVLPGAPDVNPGSAAPSPGSPAPRTTDPEPYPSSKIQALDAHLAHLAPLAAASTLGPTLNPTK
jgi:hypothetical protein